MSEVRRVYILPQGCAWTIWSTNIDALFIHICTMDFKISHRLLTLIHSPVLLLHPCALSQLFFAHIWAMAVDYSDAAGCAVKSTLIQPHTHGIMLDLSACA